MNFRLLLCVLILLSCRPFPATGETKPAAVERKNMIGELIRGLGDDDFVVRQQNEALLIQIGIDAYAELQVAKTDPDAEIAARARYLLSRFESLYGGPRDFITDLYDKAEVPFQKAAYLRCFAHPLEYGGGAGLPLLTHKARFERDRSLRIEAIKALIASPPESFDQRQAWYRHLAETFAEPGSDEPLRLLSDYAKLRTELDDLRENAWQSTRQGLLEAAGTSGRPVEIPDEVLFPPIPGELRSRAVDLARRLKDFQADPEFSLFKPGHWIDILYCYAMAELLDAAGETEARDQAVAGAVSVQSTPYPNDPRLKATIINEERKNFDHYTVGRILRQRYRLGWAGNHLRITIDEGDALLRVLAGEDLAECHRLRNDFPAAISAWEERRGSAARKEYKDFYGNSDAIAAECQVRIAVLKGLTAAERGNWEEVAQCLAAGKKAVYEDPFLLVLQRRYERNVPDVPETVRDETSLRLLQTLKTQHAAMNGLECPTDKACHVAALLMLGEPDGSVSAVDLARLALRLRPQMPEYLDTLGRICFFRKQYAEAAEARLEAIRLAPEAMLLRTGLQESEHVRE